MTQDSQTFCYFSTRFWIRIDRLIIHSVYPSLTLHPIFQPILESRFKLQDTCGVHNLHGMPGVLGAILGVVVAALATHEAYGDG